MATLLLIIIYIAFISLGLPDALLGAAWPVMQPDLAVPYSLAGLAQMTISGGTIVSSAFSGRFLKKFGTGRVTAVSVALTAAALFGFALTPSFWWLFAAAVPLGLGAGAVDSGLNAFVAAHYESRHMSWLHSFWGIGALSGPLVLSFLLSRGLPWRRGYLSIGIFQVILVAVLIFAVPLWEKVRARGSVAGGAERKAEKEDLAAPNEDRSEKAGRDDGREGVGLEEPQSETTQGESSNMARQFDDFRHEEVLAEGTQSVSARPDSTSNRSLFSTLKIKGVSFALITFLFYCGMESTMGLWGGSYLFLMKNLDPAAAARWVSLFYASITLGRFLTGFITFKLSNKTLVRWGGITILFGVVLLLLPLPTVVSLIGFLLIGLGCAPIFPCMLHETPVNFGPADSQAIMGFQMAVAYVGASFLPPIFGFISSATSMALFPLFLLAYITLLLLNSEALRRAVRTS